MGEIHSKIVTSVDIMISDAMLKLQFYGEFCQFINFRESHAISTCGVRVDVQGMQYHFNSKFVDTLTQGEMNFIMLHEIFHLLWEHQARTRRCGYDHQLSNIVQDMIINDVIKSDIVDRMIYFNKKENRNLNFAEIPINRETNKVWVLHKPKEYIGELSFEDLYEWLIKEKEKFDNWKNGCDCGEEKCKSKYNQGDIKCSCPDCPVSDYLRSIFEQIEIGIDEWLDAHLPDDVPPEYRKSIIEDIKNNLRARGILTGDIEKTLDKITKSKKDYIKNIKIGINELFGTCKHKSITRRNRRSIPGVKGKRKESYALVVILDTSGSMESYFEKALSYIFQNDIVIKLIQIDTEVKDYVVIKSKHDLQKMKISGLGGTCLTPAIQYVIKNKDLKKLNLLILTDGMTDVLDFTGFNNKCLILSRDKKCKITNARLNVKQIEIKD
jgi:predicted metal-dependent peptidase